MANQNWWCANKSTLETLKCSLGKAIRVDDFASYTAHSAPIFKRLKLLNFDHLYKLETGKFLFQINKDASSSTLGAEFLKTKIFIITILDNLLALVFSLQLISTDFKKNFLIFEGVGILCL